MKYFCASVIGNRVNTDGLHGKVLHVFKNAVNIDGPEKQIISLISGSTPDQPSGIRIACPPEFSFLDHFSANDIVGCKFGFLQVQGREFVVDLRRADVWSSNLAIPRPAIDGQDIIEPFHHLAASFQVRSSSRTDCTSKLPTKALSAVINMANCFTDAIQDKDLEKLDLAVENLIGFGPGLTPWGDDFLVGFLAAYEWLSHRDASLGEMLRSVRRLCHQYAHLTSDVSRSQLLDATEGYYNQPLKELIQTIARKGTATEIHLAAQHQLMVGDTSGEAGCYGVLSGISTVQPDDPQSPEDAADWRIGRPTEANQRSRSRWANHRESIGV